MDVDMSPEAVMIRLKRVSQLRRLCLELGKMKPVASTSTSDANGGANDPGSPIESRESRDRRLRGNQEEFGSVPKGTDGLEVSQIKHPDLADVERLKESDNES